MSIDLGFPSITLVKMIQICSRWLTIFCFRYLTWWPGSDQNLQSLNMGADPSPRAPQHNNNINNISTIRNQKYFSGSGMVTCTSETSCESLCGQCLRHERRPERDWTKIFPHFSPNPVLLLCSEEAETRVIWAASDVEHRPGPVPWSNNFQVTKYFIQLFTSTQQA